MIKRQALALTLIALALTAFSLALSGRDAGGRRADMSRRLIPFRWDKAERAVVTRPDGTVSLFRDKRGDGAGQWRLELPGGVSDDLSPEAAESFAALAALAWRERVPGLPPPEAASAVTLEVTAAGGASVAVALGETRSGLRSAAVDGDASAVFGVNRDLAAFLDWPESRFRSMLLASPGGGAKPVAVRISPAAPGRELDVALEERGPGWMMTEPVPWPVDENRLDILLRWLDRLRAEGIAAEMTGDPAYFGFDGDSAFVEALYRTPDGETRRRVEFGGDAGDGKVYARETGRSPVFALPREALAEISLDVAARHPGAWRNFFRRRTLDRVGGESPERIVVERLLPRPARLTIARAADPGARGWTGTLEEDGRTRTFAVDAPDGKNQMLPLASLFTGLANLRVKNFLVEAAPGPETARLTAHPAWRFSLFAADGRELPGLTLYAHDAGGRLPGGEPYAEGEAGTRELAPLPGVPAGSGMAFSVPDRDAVMETFSELSYLLCLPPYRYQSRRLVDADPAEWTRLEVSVAPGGNGGNGRTLVYTRRKGDVNEQWLRGGAEPEPLMDDNNRLVALLLQLSQLGAEEFVQDVSGDVSKFGLDRPAITAIVYSSSGQVLTLHLGGEADASGRRFARIGGGPVFIAPAQVSGALGTEYR